MGWGVRGGLAALAALVLLSGCGRVIPETRIPPAPTKPLANAVRAGVTRGPAVSGLRLTPANAAAALSAFSASCPRLLTRVDGSGLTRGADWQPACTAAASWPPARAQEFFPTYFEAAKVSDGKAFVTGYYEPEIAGVRTRQPGFDVPIYGLPHDLVRAWPAETPPDQRTGKPPLGRYDESGRFVPYYERAEIVAGALAGKGLEIAWAADPVEFYFLQVQGSGRLRAPDGSIMRIGYAGQNGRDYASIGALMRARGLLGDGPGQYPSSMQGIMRYLREHPVEGAALMDENKSWVFFEEVPGAGPLGGIGVPVRERTSVAADRNFVPLGAPVWLDVDRPEVNGLWVAQDVGGAIKGPNRFDSFWGAGDAARTIAGGMAARGQALLLLPKGTLDRLAVP